MSAVSKAAAEPLPWNFKALGLAMALGCALQGANVFFDKNRAAQTKIALIIYEFLTARIIVAWLAKERGAGWKAYSAIALLTPLYLGLVALFVYP